MTEGPWTPQQTAEVVRLCQANGWVQPIIHQPNYSLLRRQPEQDVFPACERHGLGTIAFCPLAQGLLTNRYLSGIPADSRAGKPHGFLRPEHVTEEKLAKVGLSHRLRALLRSRSPRSAMFCKLVSIR